MGSFETMREKNELNIATIYTKNLKSLTDKTSKLAEWGIQKKYVLDNDRFNVKFKDICSKNWLILNDVNFVTVENGKY